jgi:NADH-quinone oxidoreductase subunit G
MEDVAGEAILNVSERGDRAHIGIDEGHLLDHPWAGNVVDLCPVGSLISKDFLHKARAWDLDKTASVCTGCSQGCNITIDTRDNTVVRLRPRANLEVNRHFMCDTGRTNYRWMNRGDRIEAPLVREAGRHAAVDWDAALDRFAGLVRGATGSVVLLASARLSTESLAMLKRLGEGKSLRAAVRIPVGEEAPLAGVSGLALRRERAPNGEGARMLGYGTDWEATVAAASSAALAVVVDEELTAGEAAQVAKAKAVVVLGTAEPQVIPSAQVVLPLTNTAEETGTFVNRDRRVQRYLQARAAPGMAQPVWWVAAETLGRVTGRDHQPTTAALAFAVATSAIPALGGLTHDSLGLTGQLARAGAEPAAAGAPS